MIRISVPLKYMIKKCGQSPNAKISSKIEKNRTANFVHLYTSIRNSMINRIMLQKA